MCSNKETKVSVQSLHSYSSPHLHLYRFSNPNSNPNPNPYSNPYPYPYPYSRVFSLIYSRAFSHAYSRIYLPTVINTLLYTPIPIPIHFYILSKSVRPTLIHKMTWPACSDSSRAMLRTPCCLRTQYVPEWRAPGDPHRLYSNSYSHLTTIVYSLEKVCLSPMSRQTTTLDQREFRLWWRRSRGSS